MARVSIVELLNCSLWRLCLSHPSGVPPSLWSASLQTSGETWGVWSVWPSQDLMSMHTMWRQSRIFSGEGGRRGEKEWEGERM